MTGEPVQGAGGEGSIVLVATPIGNLGDLSPRAVSALAAADVIYCEDTRHSRKLLTHAGITGPTLRSLHEHNEDDRIAEVLQDVAAGRAVAVVSDAGMPGISDPGSRLVAVAAAAGVSVSVVPGPSAVVAALVVSGLATDRFCFEGFLPRSGRDRRIRLEQLSVEQRTSVLFEAPGRVLGTLDDLAVSCGGGRRVAVARELTKLHEQIWRGTLDEARSWASGTAVRGGSGARGRGGTTAGGPGRRRCRGPGRSCLPPRSGGADPRSGGRGGRPVRASSPPGLRPGPRLEDHRRGARRQECAA